MGDKIEEKRRQNLEGSREGCSCDEMKVGKGKEEKRSVQGREGKM